VRYRLGEIRVPICARVRKALAPADALPRHAIVLPMTRDAGQTRTRWWALATGIVGFAAALSARAQLGGWLFGAVLLVASGLLAFGISVLRIAKPLRAMLAVSAFALAAVIWNHLAAQPRLQLGELRVQKFPSTISPGVVELTIHNSGALPAAVTGAAVADLGPRFRTPGDLATGGVEAELSDRLAGAERLPSSGTMLVAPGQSTRVQIDIPPTKRSWFIARGETTVLVTARFQYRDRLFVRERSFCVFLTPPSGQWSSCPFLNE
jgi:hypothetical protein